LVEARSILNPIFNKAALLKHGAAFLCPIFCGISWFKTVLLHKINSGLIALSENRICLITADADNFQ
jgi:hypothetical protein